MNPKNSGSLREGLTFDDVLLKPGLSEILPSRARASPPRPRRENSHPQKAKAPRCRHRGAFLLAYDVDYFDIDFSNMRLSFSLFASQHCCAACAADAA
jgi:hypothetical protein